MPALRELQVAFAAVVLQREEPAEHGLMLAPADERLPRRLGVYRVNARENFAAALAAAFPVLALELGAERFRGLAASYQREYPSPSGHLFEVGRRLPDYLAAELRGGPEEYLADLARLEWAVQEAMVAADADEPFDAVALAAVPADRHAALQFRLHPSVRLVATGYPVFESWQASQVTAATQRRPGGRPVPAPEYLLVRRHEAGIELWRLDAATFEALSAIAAGGSLGDLAERALSGSVPPDPGAWLTSWVARGVITGFDASASS